MNDQNNQTPVEPDLPEFLKREEQKAQRRQGEDSPSQASSKE